MAVCVDCRRVVITLREFESRQVCHGLLIHVAPLHNTRVCHQVLGILLFLCFAFCTLSFLHVGSEVTTAVCGYQRTHTHPTQQ